MKKILLCILSALFSILLCTTTVHAEEPLSYDETLSALLDASGTEEMLAEHGVEESLLAQGIELDDPNTLTSVSFERALEQLAQQALDAAALPLRTFGLLLGVILLSAFADSLQSSRASVAAIYEMVCVLCAVGVIAEPISNVFIESAQQLSASAGFMLNFSMIFGAVLAACGGITAAAGYQTAMLAVCEIAMQLAVHMMLPILSMGLALSIVDAVNPAISLGGVVKFLHKVVIWMLGLLMTVFLGMLTLQSMTAVSADGFTSKTTKFVISNSIPFVGGAVSDAYSTVLGSLGVLRSTTGIIGILSVLTLLLPVVLELGIYRLLTAAAASVAEIFAVQRLTRLLKNTESILAAAFSVSVSFCVIFIVSTAIMLLLGGSLTS